MRTAPRLHSVLLASACIVALASACGDERRPPAALPDGATLQFDAAMIPAADAGTPRDLGRDSGPPDAGPTLPPATVNPDGVLTPFPHIRFDVLSPGFEIVTVNFTVEEDGDSRGPLLQAYIEVRNIGSNVRCGFLPEIFLDYYTELLARLDAEPYYERHGTTMFNGTADCIPPGGVGVIDALQRGVSEADLASASRMTLDVGAYDYDPSYVTYSPALGDLLVTRSVIPVMDGFALSGTVTPQRTIYNFALYTYARDSRGVLFAKVSAFPGVLETLPAYVAQPYESDAAPRAFTTYLSFPTWINR